MTNKKNIWNIIGIACGVVIIILGVVILSTDLELRSGTHTGTAAFGGDFYTYIYEATSNAANNVQSLCSLVSQSCELIVKGFEYLLLAIGLTDICLFGTKISTLKDKTVNNEELLQKESEKMVDEISSEDTELTAEVDTSEIKEN